VLLPLLLKPTDLVEIGYEDNDGVVLLLIGEAYPANEVVVEAGEVEITELGEGTELLLAVLSELNVLAVEALIEKTYPANEVVVEAEDTEVTRLDDGIKVLLMVLSVLDVLEDKEEDTHWDSAISDLVLRKPCWKKSLEKARRLHDYSRTTQ